MLRKFPTFFALKLKEKLPLKFKKWYYIGMKKVIAIKKFQEKFDVNHILANSFISQLNQKTFSDEDLNKIFNKYKEAKARPLVKWVGGKKATFKTI